MHNSVIGAPGIRISLKKLEGRSERGVGATRCIIYVYNEGGWTGFGGRCRCNTQRVGVLLVADKYARSNPRGDADTFLHNIVYRAEKIDVVVRRSKHDRVVYRARHASEQNCLFIYFFFSI
jgi:hypothetical protein